jgi:hypothetical protein
MATLRQKNLAKEIVAAAKSGKKTSAGAILEKVGYSKATSRGRPGDIIAQEGVQEELKVLGFDPESAMKVVAKILHGEKTRDEVKLKASEQVFKVHGSYAPEKKHISGSMSLTALLVDEVEDDNEGLIADDG